MGSGLTAPSSTRKPFVDLDFLKNTFLFVLLLSHPVFHCCLPVVSNSVACHSLINYARPVIGRGILETT